MPVMLLTGNDIKRLRISLKMNQREFGEMLGVTDAAVNYWEFEKRRPRYDMMARLSQLAENNKNGGRKSK